MCAQQPDHSFRPDIEGLRGVAVLLVVACHCGISWCAGGFVGVDVFFVLSGYLITGQLVAEYRATHRLDLVRFFSRRARRLLPAGALVLLATALAAAAIYPPQDIASTGRAAGAAALFISNVLFDRTASNYFAPNVWSNPLLHTWSLGVEEQFYLIWPLLILLANRGMHRTGRPVWLLAAFTGVSLTFCLVVTRLAPTIAFYELPARAWEFGAGGLLALMLVSRVSVSTRGAVVLGIAGLAMILGTALVLKGGAGFPGWIALFPVVGTLATLAAGAWAPQRGIGTLLGAGPLQFLGVRSYAWYLWHWPFIVFAGVIFPGITVSGKIAASLAALLASMVTFLLVERPVRASHYLTARSGPTLGLAVATTLLTIASALCLVVYGRHQLTLDDRYRLIEAASSDIGNLPKGCWSEGTSFEAKVCEFGDADAAHTLVLFGDSHAMQWFNPMQTATRKEAWRLITILRPGCAASDINPHLLSAAADHCRQWRASAIDKIVAIRPAAVVMASYNGATLRGDFTTATLMPAEEIYRGTRRTLEKLSSAGLRTVVLRDTPLPPFNIPFCLARRESGRFSRGESCDFGAVVALNSAAYAAEQASAEGLPEVYFLDMDDLICPGTMCPAMVGDLLVYRDEDHVTGTFAESLASSVRRRLFQIVTNVQPAEHKRGPTLTPGSAVAVARFD